MPKNQYFCQACEYKCKDFKDLALHVKDKDHITRVRQLRNGDCKFVSCKIAIRYFQMTQLIQSRLIVSQVVLLMTCGNDNDDGGPVPQHVQFVREQMKIVERKVETCAMLMDKLAENEETDSPTKMDVFEDIAQKIINENKYTIGQEDGVVPGSKECQLLAANLDFDDEKVLNCNLFNMCAKCGMAAPGKLWWNRDEGTSYDPDVLKANVGGTAAAWQKKGGKYNYKCLIEWNALISMAADEVQCRGQEGGACQMLKHMDQHLSLIHI